LVIKDDAGNVLHAFDRTEQKLAVIAAVLLRRLDTDRIEALLDGAARFVRGQNALAWRDHRGRHFVQFVEIHSSLHRILSMATCAYFTLSTSTPGKGL